MRFADRVSCTNQDGRHLVVKAHARKGTANVLRGRDWIAGVCHGPLGVDVYQPHLTSEKRKKTSKQTVCQG